MSLAFLVFVLKGQVKDLKGHQVHLETSAVTSANVVSPGKWMGTAGLERPLQEVPLLLRPTLLITHVPPSGRERWARAALSWDTSLSLQGASLDWLWAVRAHSLTVGQLRTSARWVSRLQTFLRTCLYQ